jgi:hypothetical protein
MEICNYTITVTSSSVYFDRGASVKECQCFHNLSSLKEECDFFTVHSNKWNLSWSAVEEAETAARCGRKKPAGLHCIGQPFAAMGDSGKELKWTWCALKLKSCR